MVKVKISGLAIDTTTSSPVVLLSEENGNRMLPIWIGPSEASALALELAGITLKRPLTHDLLKSCLDGLDTRVGKVIINSLVENTFHAELFLERGESFLLKIDARPSDSIILALKSNADIFVDEMVIPTMITRDDTDQEESPDDLRDRLRRIDPADFGNFSFE